MSNLFKTARLFALIFAPGLAWAQGSQPVINMKATLSSFSQVPSVLAKSTGQFNAFVNPNGTISFSLSYSGMSESPRLLAATTTHENEVQSAYAIQDRLRDEVELLWR
jgi:hypothetical protein